MGTRRAMRCCVCLFLILSAFCLVFANLNCRFANSTPSPSSFSIVITENYHFLASNHSGPFVLYLDVPLLYLCLLFPFAYRQSSANENACLRFISKWVILVDLLKSTRRLIKSAVKSNYKHTNESRLDWRRMQWWESYPFFAEQNTESMRQCALLLI